MINIPKWQWSAGADQGMLSSDVAYSVQPKCFRLTWVGSVGILFGIPTLKATRRVPVLVWLSAFSYFIPHFHSVIILY